eukprot:1192103-Prorocentrum_minimum.AAC.1
MASVNSTRENQILSRVIRRRRNKVLTVNSTASVSSPVLPPVGPTCVHPPGCPEFTPYDPEIPFRRPCVYPLRPHYFIRPLHTALRSGRHAAVRCLRLTPGPWPCDPRSKTLTVIGLASQYWVYSGTFLFSPSPPCQGQRERVYTYRVVQSGKGRGYIPTGWSNQAREEEARTRSGSPAPSHRPLRSAESPAAEICRVTGR